jgi:hypothetical protein
VLEVEAPRAAAVAAVEAPRDTAAAAVEEAPRAAAVEEEPRGCTTAVVAPPSPVAPSKGFILRQARWHDDGGVAGQRRLHRRAVLGDEDAELRHLVVRHVLRELEILALRHGLLPFVEDGRDVVIAVVLHLLVMVRERLDVVVLVIVGGVGVVVVVVAVVVVVVLRALRRLLTTCWRLLSSWTSRRCSREGKIHVAHEARPSSLIRLGQQIRTPTVGVDGVRRIISLPSVTGSGTLLLPLPEASKSFFFPMALQRWWCERRCGRRRNAARRLLRAAARGIRCH